jgi:type IV secretory pathway VirB2 component (pilin)
MLAPKRERRRDRRRTSTKRRPSPTARGAVAKLWRQAERAAAAPMPASSLRSRGVRAGVLVLALALGSYAAMVALMWLTFARTGEGLFVMLIVTLVFAAFVAVPLILLGLARRESAAKPASLREYLERSTGTFTGPLNGRAALVQIIVVPALLTLCIAGIAIALALAR